mmetsp:Transcript_5225/g.11522  ORF Transcript_5225/g.11522 Transcript_5225/m.11522 type:complete len:413 (-) Transcript_5225:42-1280(-)
MTGMPVFAKLHPHRIQEGIERISLDDDDDDEQPNVQSLSILPYRSMDRLNAECLADFIHQATSVSDLHLHCSLNEQDGADTVLAEMLQESDHMQRMFWHGGMATEQEEVILNCLQTGLALNQSVQALHLSKFDFSANRLRFLLKNLLQSKVDLRRLTFLFCHFGPNIACLLDGLKAQQQLQHLKLSCALSDGNVASILQTQVHSPCLVALHLETCQLQEESYQVLESLLQTTSTLEELHVPGQFLSSCPQRRARFRSVLQHHNTTLQRLYIARSRVNHPTVEACLQRNRTMARVSGLLRQPPPPARQQRGRGKNHSSSSNNNNGILAVLPHALAHIAARDSFATYFTVQKVSGLLTTTTTTRRTAKTRTRARTTKRATRRKRRRRVSDDKDDDVPPTTDTKTGRECSEVFPV